MPRPARPLVPRVRPCEARIAPTVVVVLNGSGYGASGPNALTASAAAVFRQQGFRTVQLAYPALRTPAVVEGVARQVARIGRTEPVALVGFSAGGALAERVASLPGANVRAVLSLYGTPDLRDFFAVHGNDSFAAYVRRQGRFSRSGVDAFSGPGTTTVPIIAAFGTRDRDNPVDAALASFARDFPGGHAYTYDGPHGVSARASVPALDDFLSRL